MALNNVTIHSLVGEAFSRDRRFFITLLFQQRLLVD